MTWLLGIALVVFAVVATLLAWAVTHLMDRCASLDCDVHRLQDRVDNQSQAIREVSEENRKLRKWWSRV